MTIRKKVPQLRAIAQPERSTAVKARESWHVLGIISEFVEATEKLADVRPAVSIFGSARAGADTPLYARTHVMLTLKPGDVAWVPYGIGAIPMLLPDASALADESFGHA